MTDEGADDCGDDIEMNNHASLTASLTSLLAPVLLLACACEPPHAFEEEFGEEPDIEEPTIERGGELDPWALNAYGGVADLEYRDDDSGTLVVVYQGDFDGPVVDIALTNANGEFSVALQPGLTYALRFSAEDDRFLDVAGIWDAPSEASPLPDAMLLLGDLDGNDLIDENDGSILEGAQDCDAPTAPAIFEDLDGDGVVCDDDLDIVVANIGEQGPLAWTFGVSPRPSGEEPSPAGVSPGPGAG